MTAGLEAHTWVVVPALNEADVIRRSLAELREVLPNVVVVDDGSADATSAEALAGGAVVVRHPLNLGQGAAIQTGIEYALGCGAAYVATFDADGQHRAEDLRRMLDPKPRSRVVRRTTSRSRRTCCAWACATAIASA